MIEDAAHALMSRYKGWPAGSFGHLSTFSFHETKNLISGEGGALVINDPQFVERAEIIWEKGTNCTQFSRGRVESTPGWTLAPRFAWRADGGVSLGTARAGRTHHRPPTRALEPLSRGVRNAEAIGLRA